MRRVRLVREAAAAIILVAAALVYPAPSLSAQERLLERHTFEENEGRLIAYYSSILAFSPGGALQSVRSGSVSLGVEATYVPELNEAQRTAGFDKPEATNFTPVLPRSRGSVALPGNVLLEASWIPPVRAFGIKANVFAAAISRPVWSQAEYRVVPRISFLVGRVRGPITCSDELARGNTEDLVYFNNVCHANESDDYFEPRHVSAEIVLSRTVHGGRWMPYAGGGGRWERSRFDIGVIRSDGSRDPDHPVLEMEATRPHGFAGVSWLPGSRARFNGEFYYAPGSLATLRVSANLNVNGR